MRWSWWARLLTVLSVPAMRLRWRLFQERRAHEAEVAAVRADAELRAARVAAEHEARVVALTDEARRLRREATEAVQTCDVWQGLERATRHQLTLERERGNRLAGQLRRLADLTDDESAIPPHLAARIRELAGRTWATETTLTEQPNKAIELRRELEVHG